MNTFAIFRDFCEEYAILFDQGDMACLFQIFEAIFDRVKTDDIDTAQFGKLLLEIIPVQKGWEGMYYLDIDIDNMNDITAKIDIIVSKIENSIRQSSQ
jgi:uncharacterized protein YfeS